MTINCFKTNPSQWRAPLASRQAPALALPPRSGVTLAEVLISMAVLTIGLLGAAAMFPVGSYFLQKGEIADRGAAIAQAAFADLVARGDLGAENWRVWRGSGSSSMRNEMNQWMQNPANDMSVSNPVGYQNKMTNDMGYVFVIDPLGTASAAKSGLPWADTMMAPYGADAIDQNGEVTGGVSIDTISQWESFSGDVAWPVRRLCTNSMTIAGIPNEAVGNAIYKSSDDLNFIPSDQDGATVQRLVGDLDGDGIINPSSEVAIARESRGEYSWMAMVAPTHSNAREAIALDPSAYYYDVSVIVFFKRQLNNINLSERLVGGRVLSTGTGGGELLLTQLQGDTTTNEPFADLRSGQWIMVSGPHPTSTPRKPLFFTQWYRVLAVDETPRGNGFVSETQQRLVGLRGPDWPWQAGAPIRVGLFPGAVAVHTKTMRLESFGEFQRQSSASTAPAP